MKNSLIVSAISLVAFLHSNCRGAEPAVRFDRDILPILSDRCFHCHGPDAEQRAADLRLDQEESAKEDRGGYAAVTPGDLEKSELYARITAEIPELKMPPEDSHRKPLTEEEISKIEQWIEQGAKWGKHWSFTQPTRPNVPDSTLHPIDAFIRQRLKQTGLEPSPEASRRTLIRRVSLDLTGLPPTPAEVTAFLKDDSPDAYEKLVDRLLESPHYGERMAWPWLDAARYADTSGYQGDPERTMWPWRDWVIDALNENMPFDQFTIEQLAGDLLPEPTDEQRLATGFNRNHMHNSEGGRIAEETRVENVFDRTETTGTVWLGLTLECARCHDHKFDPTSNQDYFAFYDFFNQTSEDGRTDRSDAVPPSMAYRVGEDKTEITRLNRQIANLQQLLIRPDEEADQAQVQWEQEWRNENGPGWQPLTLEEFRSTNGATINKQSAGTLHVTGKRPEKDTYEIQATSRLSSIEALRLDALLDPQSPAGGTGRDEGGNFVLSEIEVSARPYDDPNAEPVPVQFARTEADFAQGGYTIDKAIDGKLGPNNGWAVSGHQIKKPRWAHFVFNEPIQFEGGARLKIRLRFESQHTHHTLALFRLSATESESIPQADPQLTRMIWTDPEERSDQEEALLREHYRTRHHAKYEEIGRKLRAAKAERDRLQSEAKKVNVMVMDTREEPRDTFILVKGIYNNLTDRKVTADVPAMLPPLPPKADGERYNRLDLARWIVSSENPLTARVTVNRYWQTFFGRGIVSTPYDFGLQGAQPTHPELLDWLAVEFIESGWDVKHMHKLIVMSETYRQSARITPEMREIDPENKLLARAPLHRMPSWMLRDQALAVSGLLISEIGGPPVKPYQPDGVWAEATFGKKKYQRDEGDDLYRRSIYTFWRRIVGPTMFFDASKRQTCQVKPNRTNTPLHALTTLNDVTYVEAARALAGRVLREQQTASDRIEWAFVALTARQPEADELQLLQNRLQEYLQRYRESPESADELLSVGASSRDPSLDAAEQAAYTALFNMLMNLDETLVKP